MGSYRYVMFHTAVFQDVPLQAEVLAEQVPGGPQHGCLWCSFSLSKCDTTDLLPEETIGFEGGDKIFPLRGTFCRSCDSQLGEVHVSAFLIILTAMEGRTTEEIARQWKEKFLPTFSTAVTVWPVIMAVNYKFVPLKIRSVYIAVCNFFWIIFLAHQKNRDAPWKSPLLRMLT